MQRAPASRSTVHRRRRRLEAAGTHQRPGIFLPPKTSASPLKSAQRRVPWQELPASRAPRKTPPKEREGAERVRFIDHTRGWHDPNRLACRVQPLDERQNRGSASQARPCLHRVRFADTNSRSAQRLAQPVYATSSTTLVDQSAPVESTNASASLTRAGPLPLAVQRRAMFELVPSGNVDERNPPPPLPDTRRNARTATHTRARAHANTFSVPDSTSAACSCRRCNSHGPHQRARVLYAYRCKRTHSCACACTAVI